MLWPTVRARSEFGWLWEPNRSAVLQLVLRHAAVLVLFGVMLGLVLASMLYEMSSLDPWTFLVAGTVLVGVAPVASLGQPGRRLAWIP